MRALAASLLTFLALGLVQGDVHGVEAEDELNGEQVEELTAISLPAGYSGPEPADGRVSPGREIPATPAIEGAYLFSWQRYHSLLVIGTGTGTCRPAWVITYQVDTQDIEVAYRANAFRDAKGVLHIDARSALMIGPKASQWSPDSFAVFTSGAVQSQDDDPEHQHESGVVTRLVGRDDVEYQALQLLAQALVGNDT